MPKKKTEETVTTKVYVPELLLKGIEPLAKHYPDRLEAFNRDLLNTLSKYNDPEVVCTPMLVQMTIEQVLFTHFSEEENKDHRMNIAYYNRDRLREIVPLPDQPEAS